MTDDLQAHWDQTTPQPRIISYNVISYLRHKNETPPVPGETDEQKAQREMLNTANGPVLDIPTL